MHPIAASSTSPRSARRDITVALVAFTGFAAGALIARRRTISPLEQRCFLVVNGTTRRLNAPVWVVMQLGSLGGALATGSAFAASGRRELGVRIACSGTATWAAAKVIKRFVGRGRPVAELGTARLIGREQAGLGYPSGHAAVAATIAMVASAGAGRGARAAWWSAALAVGPGRMYVGAHLPLDVLGGIAFGVATGAATRALTRVHATGRA